MQGLPVSAMPYWVPGPMPPRIEDYALIGKCESTAMVGRNGSIDWLALPRFDAARRVAAKDRATGWPTRRMTTELGIGVMRALCRDNMMNGRPKRAAKH